VDGELKVETESAPTCDWWNESRVEAIERSCANPINRTCDREFQNPCRNYRAILKAHFMSITIYPTYRFADAPAMLDWLERAFGFRRRAVHMNDDGTVAHAEMALGDALIMFKRGSPRVNAAPASSQHSGAEEH